MISPLLRLAMSDDEPPANTSQYWTWMNYVAASRRALLAIDITEAKKELRIK